MGRKAAKSTEKHTRRGRPSLADPRTAYLPVRVAEADLAAIDAARGDQSRSTWVYDVIRRALAS